MNRKFRISLKSYITASIIISISIFYFISASVDLLKVRKNLSDSKTENFDLVLKVFEAGVRSPVLQGSYTEIQNRIDLITQNRKDICLEIIVGTEQVGNCESFVNGKEIKKFFKEILFSEPRGPEAGEIKMYSSYEDVKTKLRERVYFIILYYSLATLLIFIVINLISKRAEKELKILTSGQSGIATYENLIIKEFYNLGIELHEIETTRNELVSARLLNRISKQIAHDIRAPIAALQVAASRTNEEFVKAKPLVLSAIDRIKSIAESLMQSKPHMSSKNESSFKVSELVTNIIAEKKMISPNTEFNMIAKQDFEIKANKVLFARAISNYLNNSVEAKVPERDLIVEILIDGNSITISDNGSGISAEILQSLKAGISISSKKSGHGLGFIGSNELLQSMGFIVAVHSEITVGTTIIITMGVSQN